MVSLVKAEAVGVLQPAPLKERGEVRREAGEGGGRNELAPRLRGSAAHWHSVERLAGDPELRNVLKLR